MKRLLVITPHLSTGGAPQVTVNKLELLKDEYQILCVEYRRISWDYNVQRNRLIQIVGENNFISLEEDKLTHLKQILEEFKPEIISMEEFPEFFMERESSELIYSKDRTYKILETTHDSSFKPKDKKFFPDKFVFVSAYNAFKYSFMDIPYDIVEYPVDYKGKNQKLKQEELNLESSWKHVTNVGLFTPRKNQAYIFELAEKLKDFKIKFHFLGNQAPNFEYYWKPLMDNKPNNCVVWGERDDVNNFLEASDLFLFTSRGDRNNKELNPIAIKEALEFRMPMLMHNLDVYCGKYNNFENITFLSGDIETDSQKILEILNPEKLSQIIDIQNTIEVGFDENTNSIHFSNRNNFSIDLNVSIRCLTSKSPMYWINFKPQPFGGWYATPIPKHVLSFKGNPNFRGFLLEFYDKNEILLGTKEIVVNDIYPILPEVNFLPFDCSYRNYIEFFKDDIYGSFNLNDLDTVLDVGANIGLFAKYMYSKNANKVILVEANPLLRENIKTVMDDKYEEESTYLAPLFRDKRKVSYKYSSNNSTIGTVVFDENPHDYRELDSELEIETVTFDEIIKNHNLNRISLFKCDIEGGEYDLIESMTDSQMDMVDRFMIEFHENTNGQLAKLIQKLEKHGFESKLYKLDMVHKKAVTVDEGHGVLITNKKSSIKKHPKIKIVHLQTTNNLEKEQISRKSLEPLQGFGFEYKLHQNIPFSSLPPSHNSLRPSCVSTSLFDGAVSERGETALTPAHYGCFESFKNGILSEFSDDVDYLMVCEGDCLIEIPIQEFVDIVKRSCEIIKKENIEYFSFGDTHTLDSNNWLQSTEIYTPENQDLLFVTNKIIGLQCILFPKSVKPFLFDRLLNEKWDAADVYFNHIFNWGRKKMGILKKRITTQVDGFSMLDKEIKVFRK